MEFFPIDKASASPHPGLTPNQFIATCQRAFGPETQIASVREIGGGTFNTVYLIALRDQSKAILRVAPPPTANIFWDELALMRREHHIQPFFAPIAALMPKTILADFTHQLIDRDYMVQSFMEGERWDYIEAQLTPGENLALWRQLGQIVKQIHATPGEKFGWPVPGPQFSSWSELVIDRFERITQSMSEAQLDTTDFLAILDVVWAHTPLLDEIRQPCLLHGDLWSFNILVSRHQDGPRIAAILDADRAWWGDPMADWLIHLLDIRRDEPAWAEPQATFWQAYGKPEENRARRFRREVYTAMHAGSVRLWCWRNGDTENFIRTGDKLRRITQTLSTLFQ